MADAVIDLTDGLPAKAVLPKTRRRRATKRAQEAEQAEAEDCEAGTATAAVNPPKKRGRAKQTQGARSKGQQPVEKEKRVDRNGRTVRRSATASQQTEDRIRRAMPGSGHRLYMMDRKTVAPLGSPGGPVEEFVVLGATKNVYTVTVSRFPNCTCPDCAKTGNVCKHYLFVMLRVIGLARDDPLVWQRALLAHEVEEVLSGARSQRGVDAEAIAHQSVIAQYRRMTGQATAGDGAAEAPDKRRPIEGDCPICFDELKVGSSAAADKTTWCATCGNNLHVECLQRWCDTKRQTHQQVTCVYCRAAWVSGDGPAGGPAGPADGNPFKRTYVNMGQVSVGYEGVDTSLEALYGESAVWINAHAGRIGRGQAAQLYAASQGRL